MEKKDYYELLGLEKGADDAKIKSAYRKLAMKYHPDKNPDDKAAEAKFKEINEAYEVLSNPEKRNLYDRMGHAAFSQGGGAGPGGFSGHFEGFSFEDLLNNMFGFESFGSGFSSSSRGPRPTKGRDISVNITLPFEDAAFGKKVEIEYLRTEYCSHCSGTGGEPGSTKSKCKTCGGSGTITYTQRSLFGETIMKRTCTECNGRGESYSEPCKICKGRTKVKKRIKKTIDIPAGAFNGSRMMLRAEGDLGSNNGPRGDLYINIAVLPHKEFTRQGNDINYNLTISYTQAALGDTIMVPTLDGMAEFSIPEGTQVGKKFKLKGKGVPILNGYGRGDQNITINIDVPKKLNKTQKEMLMHFDTSIGGTLNKNHTKSGKKGFFDKMKDGFS